MNDAIFEMTIQRITDEAKTGVNAGALSSFFKYYGTEQNVARMELLTAIRGTRRTCCGKAKIKKQLTETVRTCFADPKETP